MPLNLQQIGAASAGGGGDVFLSVQTKRAGKVKGEASGSREGEIEVTGWQWGMASGTAVDSTQASARRSYSALTVHKRIDSATTALMSALATNDEVKEAVLTMRRSGGDQQEYFIITLKSARISSLQHSSDAAGETRETVTIAFAKVQVEYRPQQASGLRAGSQVFNDELLPT